MESLLELARGRRVVFFGDSVTYQIWASLTCGLLSHTADAKVEMNWDYIHHCRSLRQQCHVREGVV